MPNKPLTPEENEKVRDFLRAYAAMSTLGRLLFWLCAAVGGVIAAAAGLVAIFTDLHHWKGFG